METGTNRQHVCDFILVTSSNMGHICYRFQDIAIYDENPRNRRFYPTRSHWKGWELRDEIRLKNYTIFDVAKIYRQGLSCVLRWQYGILLCLYPAIHSQRSGRSNTATCYVTVFQGHSRSSKFTSIANVMVVRSFAAEMRSVDVTVTGSRTSVNLHSTLTKFRREEQ